jgi:hypothetical protein
MGKRVTWKKKLRGELSNNKTQTKNTVLINKTNK